VNELVEVVFLAGRLGLDDDGWPLIPLIDRLALRGVMARVVCVSRGSAAGNDPRILELRGMGSRWLTPLAIRRLHREFSFTQPRLLHVIHEEMNEPALALADTWQIPYVQTVDDFSVLDRGFKLSRRWFRGIVVASPDLAIGLSTGLGFPADRISVISPGIAPCPAVARSPSLKIPVVGAAGPALERAGFRCFLEAARIVLNSGRDAEFLIARQGEAALNPRRHAQSLRIADHVSVVDFATLGPRIWTVLDLSCQPSLAASTGRTLAQALSRSIPSIASRVTGLNDLIDHGTSGLLVPPGNPEALASAIIQLLDDPDQAAALGRYAQEAMRTRFDLEVEADLLNSLYRRHAAPAHQADDPEPG